MKTFLIFATLCLCASCTHAGAISFEAPEFQSKDALVARCHELSPAKRERIETYLLNRLGVSSTGRIQLIGAYQQPHAGDETGRSFLHFQQVDLMGTRLAWSALVDPEALKVLVLYHLDERLVTRQPVSMK